MSVFTKVSPQELAQWLQNYAVGDLVDLRGIAAGIENTNYFVTTSAGRYVLTLFEKLTAAELPFYLNLMAHLARHAIPCPAPVANREGALLGELAGRPATLVTRLEGHPVSRPSAQHCAAVGAMLARMHLAGASYGANQENPRGARWWRETAPKVAAFLDAARAALLDSELEFQFGRRTEALPRGPIHADLFRDNVLFLQQPGPPRLEGVLDFYFAGVDALLFDVAVAVNDWCIDERGEIDATCARAMFGAYVRGRPFSPAERDAWQAMLRAAALRFWLSRLYDFYCPRPGELTHAHDPEHFRRILELRRAGVCPLQ
ncbi:MAG: homoserine kinase [Betaproteobacteria bacterium]|nr:homoserine kinase [Betaproteobacteria bacterium]MBI2960955.1 homoserine kinase [Betaproteobacteria bacterium]